MLVALAKRRGLAFLIVGFVIVGAWGLSSAVGWGPALAGLLVAGLAAFAEFNEIAGRVVGAILVGTLVLVGTNVAVDNGFDALGLPRPPILLGLAFAVLVFGVAAGWYLRGNERQDSVFGRGRRWEPWTASVTAAALAVFLIIDVPIIFERRDDDLAPLIGGLGAGLALCGLGFLCRRKWAGVKAARIGAVAGPAAGLLLLAGAPLVLQQQQARDDVVTPVASKLDVRIVTDGSPHRTRVKAAMNPALRGFDVRYSIGFADGDGVRWTLLATRDRADALRVASLGRGAAVTRSKPVTRKNASSVLVLIVDGTAPVLATAPQDLPQRRGSRREVGRWRRIANAAREPQMPTFALLQTSRRARLDHWRLFTRNGGVVSLQLHGHRAATDAALALAVGPPTLSADLALAIEHRPLLLFDSSEPVPRPLSVEWLFRRGRVHVCRDRGVARTECDETPTTDPRLLDDNDTHLQLKRPSSTLLRRIATREAADARSGRRPRATKSPETAIYVHPVPIERDGQSLLYLDYWWYLPENPVTVGLKAFCGAGLVIPGITCHDHESDWEGVRVVIDRTTRRPRVISVHYAQHSEIVAFAWKGLRDRWDSDDALKRIVAAADNGAQRPLVFIASGTHASYAMPCRTATCRQFATKTGEDDYRGETPWIGNFTNACGGAGCVRLLPALQGGRRTALWNAFRGPWGKQRCALTYYCDSAEPPAAPGQQVRYKHPTRCTGVADRALKFKRQPCAD